MTRNSEDCFNSSLKGVDSGRSTIYTWKKEKLGYIANNDKDRFQHLICIDFFLQFHKLFFSFFNVCWWLV